MASQPRKGAEIGLSPMQSLQLQWGRGFSATEGCRCRRWSPPGPRLQWGRGFSATEGRETSSAEAQIVELQWGRGFSATEGHGVTAPMQPKPLGFNGAVASQPRKDISEEEIYRRAAGFNGAVASQPRKESILADSGHG